MKARIRISSITLQEGGTAPGMGTDERLPDSYMVAAVPVRDEGTPWAPNAPSSFQFPVVNASEFEVGNLYEIEILPVAA